MAKIVEDVTDILGPDFKQINVQGLSNNVQNIVQKLNTTYQQQLKDEMEAFTLFTN